MIREPANRNLEFAELIGTLYYQKKNHADLVRKKFIYFAESLRRNIQVYVEDDSDDNALSRRISRQSDLSSTSRRLPAARESRDGAYGTDSGLFLHQSLFSGKSA